MAKLVAQRTFNGGCDESGVNFVVYGVPMERDLVDIQSRLGGAAVSFREPDLGSHVTAVAYLGPHSTEFDRYTLL